MLWITITLQVIGGAALMIKGADWLVDGGVSLAQRLGISTLLIGLTVVAFGTSAPELAASVSAALQNRTGMALGNVIGSNICNIFMVIGVSAIIAPLQLQKPLRELPLLLATSILLLIMAYFDLLGRWGGLLLLAIFGGFLAYCLLHHKKEPSLASSATVKTDVPRAAALVFAGLVALALGSSIFVQGAVAIAELFGLSDETIGLTVIAIGSSLPELITSVMAATKGHSDMAMGNVVGSNLQNILIVLGVTSLIRPITDFASSIVYYDIPIMITATGLLYLMALDKRVSRTEGLILTTGYISYLTFLTIR